MQIEVRFPVDEESRKGFLDTVYMRRLNDDQIEIGITKKNGMDYAWAVLSQSEFQSATFVIGKFSAPRT